MQIKVFPGGDEYVVGVTDREEFRLYTDGTPVHAPDQEVHRCSHEFSLRRTIGYLQNKYPEYFENFQILPNMNMHVMGHFVINTDENGVITNQWAPGDI